jgi:hypothetical protein
MSSWQQFNVLYHLPEEDGAIGSQCLELYLIMGQAAVAF